MEILRNLKDYYEVGLEEIGLEERTYRTVSDYSPDLLLASAFGGSTDENSYNQILAQTVKDARNFFGKDLPTVVQAEINFNLSSEEDIFSVFEEHVYGEGERALAFSNKSTGDLFTEFLRVIKRENLESKKPLFIAHPAHIYRVLEIGKKLGLEGAPFIPSQVYWPSRDNQLWVKSPWFWVPREILTRLHHKVKGITN